MSRRKNNALRTVRIIVSMAFLMTLTLLVADLTDSIPASLSALAHIQIMPSILGLHIGVLAFWLAVTLLIGRAYCSSICPLGALQDIIARLSLSRRKKRIGKHVPPRHRTIWRIAVLAITVICAAAGIAILPALIDPYSAYVRMVDTLIQPLLALLPINPPTLTPTIVASTSAGIAVGVVSLLAVIALSFRGQRTICNTICPVGATLGLIARQPLFAIRIDPEKCVGCRLCEFKCKTGCIDAKNHKVDSSSCVMCFDCIPKCEKGAISLVKPLSARMLNVNSDSKITESHPKPEKTTFSRLNHLTSRKLNINSDTKTTESHPNPPITAFSRRKFIAVAALTTAGTIVAKGVAATSAIEKAAGENTTVIRKKYPKPPTSTSTSAFFTKCTACQLCVAKCPQRIIKPSSNQHGIMHLYQPYLNFSQGYCLNQCTLCADVCPTGALSLLSLNQKHTTPIGKAIAINANCLTQTDLVQCGACARKCPHGAINMTPSGPKVIEKACIGCGKCEHVCPASPQKAIYIEGI